MKKLTLTLLISFLGYASFSQDFYDVGTIQTIEITFAQSNWDQLLDNEAASTDNYLMATTVSINGILFDSVGVKYKGNSTYNATQIKNPFHIELDAFKNHDYQGYKDIKLSNVKNDPSFVREPLSYQIARKYMDAPKSNYANVYVNGTLMGLYVNSESITKTFVDTHFGSNNNAFFKCNPIAGAGPGTTDKPNLVHLGSDSTLYYPKYELKSDFGWGELINLCDTLKNQVNSVSQILDVDRALWMLAFDNVLVNLDSYIGAFAQNYFLYRNDFDLFIPVIWDLNESFGKFSMTGTGNLNTVQKQQMSHLLNLSDANYPLVSKLLNVPLYKRMYLAHVKTMLQENFANNDYFTQGQAMQTTISSSVQADVNKFYSFANFTANLSTDITSGGGPGGGTVVGIANLMDARSTYLLGQADFTTTEPTITNLVVSNTAPMLNETVGFTADITNATAVYMGYRTQPQAPFVRIQMFDDGLHNDGASGDGTYGIDATLTTVFFQYYFYADNANIGKFSPVRAEHEYYTLTLTAPPVGDVVINELMASNVSGEMDFNDQFEDWIELYNNTSNPINLSNYYLSDNGTDLTQWQFPSGTTIPANGFVTVWADKDELQFGLHANFKLSAVGETLYLMNGNSLVDQITFGPQTDDISFGRYVNGTGGFILMNPTFGAQNSNTLSVNAHTTETELMVYPNPANDLVCLKATSATVYGQELVIVDLSGKMMYTNTFNQNLEVDISSWSAGFYLVRVGSITTRLVVN